MIIDTGPDTNIYKASLILDCKPIGHNLHEAKIEFYYHHKTYHLAVKDLCHFLVHSGLNRRKVPLKVVFIFLINEVCSFF
jgi:hypothetical protein